MVKPEHTTTRILPELIPPITRPTTPEDITGQSWRREGLCAQADPELFYPDEYGKGGARIAKRICRRCPVETACLEYALRANERWGVWGGATANDRRRILAERQRLTGAAS